MHGQPLLGAARTQAMGDFLRRMDWLGRERAIAYLRIVAVLDVALLVVLVTTSHAGVDRNGFLLGTDFISFWTSGRMLQHGANVYDAAAHMAAQRAFFVAPKGYTAFFYPPTFLPVCWLLGLMGYFPALAGWLTVTGAFYFVAARRWLKATEIKSSWLLFMGFPAAAIVVTHGQTAFLVAGLLGLGAWLVPSRPVLAGMLLGFATIKPQFGILVPFALLLTREWKTTATAVMTALALGVLSAVLFGAQIWQDWLMASARAQATMEAGGVPFGKFITPFAALRLLGAPVSIAYAAQAVVSLVVALLLARSAWGCRWSPALSALLLTGALLATPFALDYDLVLLAFPLLWLTGEGLRGGFASYEKLAIALAFITPAFSRALGLNVGLPVTPPVLALLFWALFRRASEQPSARMT